MMPNTDLMNGSALAGAKVLVVEDEAIVALDLALSLGESGAEVVGPYYRVAKAMDCRELDDLDAAVLDVDVNGSDVFALAERLRDRGVPTLFHTARPGVDVQDYFPSALCPKPCLMARLLSRLDALIASARRPRSGGVAAG